MTGAIPAEIRRVRLTLVHAVDAARTGLPNWSQIIAGALRVIEDGIRTALAAKELDLVSQLSAAQQDVERARTQPRLDAADTVASVVARWDALFKC
jgi:hypothetical protein